MFPLLSLTDMLVMVCSVRLKSPLGSRRVGNVVNIRDVHTRLASSSLRVFARYSGSMEAMLRN